MLSRFLVEAEDRHKNPLEDLITHQFKSVTKDESSRPVFLDHEERVVKSLHPQTRVLRVKDLTRLSRLNPGEQQRQFANDARVNKILYRWFYFAIFSNLEAENLQPHVKLGHFTWVESPHKLSDIATAVVMEAQRLPGFEVISYDQVLHNHELLQASPEERQLLAMLVSAGNNDSTVKEVLVSIWGATKVRENYSDYKRKFSRLQLDLQHKLDELKCGYRIEFSTPQVRQEQSLKLVQI